MVIVFVSFEGVFELLPSSWVFNLDVGRSYVSASSSVSSVCLGVLRAIRKVVPVVLTISVFEFAEVLLCSMIDRLLDYGATYPLFEGRG